MLYVVNLVDLWCGVARLRPDQQRQLVLKEPPGRTVTLRGNILIIFLYQVTCFLLGIAQ